MRLHGKASERRTQRIVNAWASWAAPRAAGRRMARELELNFLCRVLRTWRKWTKAAPLRRRGFARKLQRRFDEDAIARSRGERTGLPPRRLGEWVAACVQINQ